MKHKKDIGYVIFKPHIHNASTYLQCTYNKKVRHCRNIKEKESGTMPDSFYFIANYFFL